MDPELTSFSLNMLLGVLRLMSSIAFEKMRRWPCGKRQEKFPLFALAGPPSAVWASPSLQGSVLTVAQSPLVEKGQGGLGWRQREKVCRKNCPLPSY